jgi:hypothetical protein
VAKGQLSVTLENFKHYLSLEDSLRDDNGKTKSSLWTEFGENDRYCYQWTLSAYFFDPIGIGRSQRTIRCMLERTFLEKTKTRRHRWVWTECPAKDDWGFNRSEVRAEARLWICPVEGCRHPSCAQQQFQPHFDLPEQTFTSGCVRKKCDATIKVFFKS